MGSSLNRNKSGLQGLSIGISGARVLESLTRTQGIRGPITKQLGLNTNLVVSRAILLVGSRKIDGCYDGTSFLVRVRPNVNSSCAKAINVRLNGGFVRWRGGFLGVGKHRGHSASARETRMVVWRKRDR